MGRATPRATSRAVGRATAYVLVTLALALAGTLVGAQLDLITFTPGSLIRATEVNRNFELVAEAIATSALPQDCEGGQIPEWDGTRWACGSDDVGAGGGGGDITAVVAGEGLTGGSASGDATLAVAFAGTGSAASAARSDHDHDDRYYREDEVDAALAALPGAEVVVTAGVNLPATLVVQRGFPSIAEAFTTARAGRLVLGKFALVSMTCADPTSDRWYFLTVDGEPVPSSAQLRRESDPGMVGTLTGVTREAIPAGTHTLGVGGQCFTGDAGSGSSTTIVSTGSVVVLP